MSWEAKLPNARDYPANTINARNLRQQAKHAKLYSDLLRTSKKGRSVALNFSAERTCVLRPRYPHSDGSEGQTRPKASGTTQS